MSTTLIGVFLATLAYIAKASGLDITIDAAQLETTVTTIATVVGLGLAYYGRIRKGDITWYGKKLTPNIIIESLPDEK